MVCAEHIYRLSERFNFATFNVGLASPFRQKWLCRFPPCILHFTGPDKPWATPYHWFRAHYAKGVKRLSERLGDQFPASFRTPFKGL